MVKYAEKLLEARRNGASKEQVWAIQNPVDVARDTREIMIGYLFILNLDGLKSNADGHADRFMSNVVIACTQGHLKHMDYLK